MMKTTKVAVALGLSVAGMAYGQTPTTPPAVGGGVYVAPFRVLDTTDQPFAGEAVRDAVTATLARQAVDVKSSAGRPASADAVAAARAAGAQYVLTGSVQTADGRVRVDGQIVDVDHPQAVLAGLTTTGTDRFEAEDEIAAQAGRALRRTSHRATTPAAAPDEPPLKASDLVAVVSPPVAAGKSYYNGSRLEQSLNTNRTPANDYAQQVYNSRTNNTFGSYSNYGYPLYGGFGFGFGGFGYGFGSGYGGFGGGFGGGYGGFAAPYGNFVVHAGGGVR